MKVCYFALRSFDQYQEGDLIPGAKDWPFISGYVSEGKVAACLVATLPDEAQEAITEYEEEIKEAQKESVRQSRKRAGLDPDVDPEAEDETAEEDADGDSEEVDISKLTKDQLVERISEQGYLDASSSSSKPELVAIAEDSDALAEGRYGDVTVPVIEGELERREIEFSSSDNKDDLIALLESDDESGESNEGDDGDDESDES